MGFDVVHLNLHKTFGTPHGSGGPGSGPVGVKKKLEPFLPVPRVVREEGKFSLREDFPDTVGRLGAFAGNTAVALRAYAYVKLLGREGLLRVAQHAVLSARYLAKKLAPDYVLAYDRPCMHEFVAKPSAAVLKAGVKTLHIAKRLIDYGFHPPTVYFPRRNLSRGSTLSPGPWPRLRRKLWPIPKGSRPLRMGDRWAGSTR